MAGSGEGIGTTGVLLASSSLGLSFGLGISLGGVVPPPTGGTVTTGGAHGAAQASGQHSDLR
jgi:hypothetical protein